MITEDYVSFETAKLLKEKGFNESCWSWYHNGNHTFTGTSRYCNSELEKYDFSKATLAHVMKWLREVHNRYIEICTDKAHNFKDIVFRPAIYDKDLVCLWESDNFSTYEQAAEATIKYCLEHLI